MNMLPQLPLHIRYSVKQLIGNRATQVGVITATSYTHASKKAQQLYNRHVWVERL